jgi:uncharacterized membrane protein YfcA
MSPLHYVLLALAGVVTGVLGAVLGTGGGVFLVPIIVLGFGLPIKYAVATSIVSVVATSSAVASTNVERGTANMRLGMTLEVATALGAIAGGLLVAWLSARVIEGIFSIALLVTAWFMWRGRTEAQAAFTGELSAGCPPADKIGRLGGVYDDPAIGRAVSYRVERLWAGLLVSLVAGSLSGLLGIGGGVFKVPALHLLCQVPIKAAAATSNFMIGVTAAASAFLYYGRGEVLPLQTAVVVLGVLGGSAIGSHVNRFIHGWLVQRIFAVLLAIVAGQMLLRAGVHHG